MPGLGAIYHGRCHMPFSYYHRLSAAGKRVYRKSDEITAIPLGNPDSVHPLTMKLKEALDKGERRVVAANATGICRLVCEDLGIEPLIVKISSRRPSSSTRELHGLYKWTEGETAVLTVWMKTAARDRVVAFKSLIRTVIHELCHHIDYAYLRLEDSFHTEGFFRRESSIYRQIVPAELRKREPKKAKARRGNSAGRKKDEPRQIELFQQAAPGDGEG